MSWERRAAVGLQAVRWTPPEGVRRDFPDHDAVVWEYGKCSACGYKGAAIKPAFNGHFESPSQRDNFINAWLAGIAQTIAARRIGLMHYALQSSAFFSGLYKGMVFVLRDAEKQTVAEFYEVTGAVTESQAVVRQVAQKRVENEPTPKRGYAVPVLGDYIGPPMVFEITREIPVIWHGSMIVRIAWD